MNVFVSIGLQYAKKKDKINVFINALFVCSLKPQLEQLVTERKPQNVKRSAYLPGPRFGKPRKPVLNGRRRQRPASSKNQ